MSPAPETRAAHGAGRRLLDADDPAPFTVVNREGRSPILLVGDHAGRRIPRALGTLGLTPAELDRHIAWDIGVRGLGERLSARLDACFVRQTYSRLVIDCNRLPHTPGSIPEFSDGVQIPGNIGLTPHQVRARIEEVFDPYHAQVGTFLNSRSAPLLVSLHSFTPSLQQTPRPWKFGVLHEAPSRFSQIVLQRLKARHGDAVGDNQPYAMSDVDHTVPTHAYPRNLDYLELEVRQDLVGDPAGVEEVAEFLGETLAGAVDEHVGHR